MNQEQFLIAVQRHAGDGEDIARRAALNTLEVFGELLTGADQRDLADQLPEPFSDKIRSRKPGHSYDLEEFYSRVEVEHGQSKGFQVEHAQAVFAALADLLDRETRVRLQKHLPEAYGPLLERREIPEHDGSKHHDSRSESRKLSSARSGSEDRLSEGAGDIHSESVAASDHPHEDDKLSSRESPPNEGHDLATGKPDPEPKQ